MIVTGAHLYVTAPVCGGVTKQRGLFMHPPYKGGTGYTFARYALTLPKLRRFSAARSASRTAATSAAVGTRTEIARHHVAVHAWHALEGNLTPWAGQAVSLLLVTDVGEKDNSSGDWGVWADCVIGE